ncbi:MAG: histidine phosphatase family protein [Clostridia bacterium]|nr:histidine phosphatase family protein [Clostridia bacterium]
MKTRLIFVRHGFSESNKGGLFTGQANVALTELGHFQAQRAAEYLKDVHIDAVYSSTLDRAFDTARPIAEARGLEITKLHGLCEIDSGDWEEKPFDDLGDLFPTEYNLWMTDLFNCQCPNGESVKEFVKRVHSTVLQIVQENQGKTVCIATHATPIRVISCFATGLDPIHLKDVPWSPNASINIIDYQDGKFSFSQRDITEHLKGFETNLPDNV